MKANLFLMLIGLLILSASCRNVDGNYPAPGGSTPLLAGSYKAKEVKEANVVVYADNATTNVIPGYAKYRLHFSSPSQGVNTVKLVESSGETFEGKWLYDATKSTLTLSNLSPRPAVGDLVFTVERFETDLLILRNTTPNLKTGETINQYTLTRE